MGSFPTCRLQLPFGMLGAVFSSESWTLQDLVEGENSLPIGFLVNWLTVSLPRGRPNPLDLHYVGGVEIDIV